MRDVLSQICEGGGGGGFLIENFSCKSMVCSLLLYQHNSINDLLSCLCDQH